jgi:hypothetical protein
MPLLSLLALCLLAWLSCVAAAGAADSSSPPPARRIWSGVVLATNGIHPGDVPERLRRYAGKLKNIFGYNQYELIGESSARMDDPNARWLAPSKDFSLSVQSHNEPGLRYPPTRISLFQGRHHLADFETNLSSERPLFIRGPFYAGGQLVIVVHARDPSEVPPVHEAQRPPYVPSNPLIPQNMAAPRERERPDLPPGFASSVPREKLHPIPAERFGPTPSDRFGPGPSERFGPPLDRFGPVPPGPYRGNLDPKMGKPLKGSPY